MTETVDTTLHAHGVSWRINRLRILGDITVGFEPCTVTALLGPNGSGKTTLLHILAGLHRLTTGKVTLGKEDVHAMPERARARQLALLEQDASTGLDLRVRQVVELGRIPHRARLRSRTDAADAIAVTAAMRLTQIDDLADRHWGTLSGGERQRTHLARAVAQQPAVLLLDEPTNHLDLGHQLDLLARVRDLQLTTVAALHDLELAAAYCDRILMLDRGRLVAAGPVGEVLEPALIAEVYGVDATVERHPTRPRPHVRWNDTIGRWPPSPRGHGPR